MVNQKTAHNQWSEHDSLTFIDYGHYFVPERELQIELICGLIPQRQGPLHIAELCCGEGLLAAALLERFPQATLHCLDGSAEMLQATERRLAHQRGRFSLEQFDLSAHDWRRSQRRYHAIVSSLAIHHLDDEQKRILYSDLYQLLEHGGALIIADIIQPAGGPAVDAAARLWDSIVRERALDLDGSREAYDFFKRERWNIFHYPDPMDKPSRLYDQLRWLEQAGFGEIDSYWMKAGHAIFGGSRQQS